MAFQDIIGHNTVVELLKRALENLRVTHAYLFAGPMGVGKEYTAIEFAKALNCQEEQADSCGECRSCRKFASGNHPDFKIIRPMENRITIEQIRALQKDLVYKPYESEWKIYIIDDADMMTLEAANSLLKTLEEPPQYAVIIMITSRKDGLLPTIISRCQLIQFYKLPKQQIMAYLQARPELTEGEVNVEEVVQLADGSIGQAIKLMDDQEIWDRRKRIIEFLLNLQHKSNLEIYELIQSLEMEKDQHQWNELMMIFRTFYRDLMILKNMQNQEYLINQSYFEQLSSLKDQFSEADLEKVINLIERTNNVIMSNVDRELALEVMLQKIKARRV